ncbi:hypothetical protein EJC49_00725 [Aquibium carbonis]|uniref:Uncharacterized protein n=1 Tax=Aquibium carbonis TaxID=2495581 RepID=A0A3R9ZUU7_9HYPH|nr:hypothetical protein [Aquibium carbonis]RST88258.1 hypothetical protein EJC49_00725 [Aquibium carbonis]
MTRRLPKSSLGTAFVALVATLTAHSTPAFAEDYDVAFVKAFADACVPQRMSYPGTVDTARAAGWRDAERTANAELDALMAKSEAEAEDPELQGTFEYTIFSRPVLEQDHYLVVSRASFIIGDEDDPLNPWVYIGCYLYNFDAKAPIGPGQVSALLEKPVGNRHLDDTLTSYVWGPPCPMPRTGDTYLTFVPEGSPHQAATGFSGLVLKFETSEPNPGEVVPETYC